MRLFVGLAVLSLAFSVGCSGGAEGGKRVPVYKVSGKIKILGSPLVGANVAFAPQEGQPIAIGRTDDAGEYHLTTYDVGDGAAKGKFKVTVMKVAVTSNTNDPGAASHGVGASGVGGHNAKPKAAAAGGSLIPEIYAKSDTTPLEATVEEKENVIDLDVK